MVDFRFVDGILRTHLSRDVTASEILDSTKSVLESNHRDIYEILTVDDDAFTAMTLWQTKDLYQSRDRFISDKGKHWYSFVVMPRKPVQKAYLDFEASAVQAESIDRYMVTSAEEALSLISGLMKKRAAEQDRPV